MRRTLASAAVVGVLLLTAVPAGASAGDDAGDALKRQYGYRDKGQYGRLYNELHPAQRKLLPKADFLRCADQAPSTASIVRVDVVETYREKVEIPGTDLNVPSIAVTARTTVRAPAGNESDTDTSHQVKVKRKWYWITDDPATFADGNCPVSYGGSASTPTTTPAAGATMTLDEFNQLQPGMTYEDVVAIVGGEGTVQFQNESGSYSSVSYKWPGNGDNFSEASVLFQNGGLSSKNQYGLE